MAEPSTVARPYAEAAYKLADAGNQLGKWSQMLAELALVAQDPRVRAAIADPKLSDAQVAGLFIAILSGKMNAEGEHFVRLLTEDQRLHLPPLIPEQFE